MSAAEVKLRAERRAGELLADMPKNPGGRSTDTTLEQVGVDRHQSHRWQRIAALTELSNALDSRAAEAETELFNALNSCRLWLAVAP